VGTVKIGTLTIIDRDANSNDLIDDPGAPRVATYGTGGGLSLLPIQSGESSPHLPAAGRLHGLRSIVALAPHPPTLRFAVDRPAQR
jgi:hypothetical protein